MRLKLLLLSLVVVGLSSCSSGGSSSDKVPTVDGQAKTCIPESELWKSSQGIVGGTRVNEYDADSKKVVMVFSVVGENAEICTAAAIAPNVLLMAAHCAVATAEKTKVFTHTSMSCESGFDFRYDSHSVSEVVANELYDKTRPVDESQNDIALVFLPEALPQGYPVYKIANPASLSLSTDLQLYGYGEVGHDQGGSGILRRTTIPASDYHLITDSGKIEVDQSKGTGVCSGDSGGPGLVSVNGELQILGVNSYVMGPQSDMCRGKGYLAIANKYRDWIKKQMWVRGRYLADQPN